MDIAVRPATLADVPALARLHVAGWQQGYRGLIPDQHLRSLSVEAYEQRWTAWLGGGGRTLVADVAPGLGAFASYGLTAEDPGAPTATGELRGLYADPARWGTGLGKAVHDAALAALGAGGCREATLWVLEGNSRAITFYERQGWRPDGARKADEVGSLTVHDLRYRLLLTG